MVQYSTWETWKFKFIFYSCVFFYILPFISALSPLPTNEKALNGIRIIVRHNKTRKARTVCKFPGMYSNVRYNRVVCDGQAVGSSLVAFHRFRMAADVESMSIRRILLSGLVSLISTVINDILVRSQLLMQVMGTIMTLWNGNTLHVTGPLWRESSGNRWITFTKGQ